MKVTLQEGMGMSVSCSIQYTFYINDMKIVVSGIAVDSSKRQRELYELLQGIFENVKNNKLNRAVDIFMPKETIERVRELIKEIRFYEHYDTSWRFEYFFRSVVTGADYR